MADFIEAVRKGHRPLVDGREGKRAVELICAIYESQASGRIIHFPS